jgi:hypothetical protein
MREHSTGKVGRACRGRQVRTGLNWSLPYSVPYKRSACTYRQMYQQKNDTYDKTEMEFMNAEHLNFDVIYENIC